MLGDRLAARREPPHHRDRAHPGGGLLVPVGRRGVDDLHRLERLGDLLLPLRLDALADEVAVEQGGRARRPCVRNGDEAVLGTGNPEHDIGEGEVSEQLPVTNEQMQPLDVFLARAPLRLD